MFCHLEYCVNGLDTSGKQSVYRGPPLYSNCHIKFSLSLPSKDWEDSPESRIECLVCSNDKYLCWQDFHKWSKSDLDFPSCQMNVQDAEVAKDSTIVDASGEPEESFGIHHELYLRKFLSEGSHPACEWGPILDLYKLPAVNVVLDWCFILMSMRFWTCLTILDWQPALGTVIFS